jgi:hypothetical protein
MNLLNIYYLNFYYKKWGLGIGDWGLGIGDWANPQSPIPICSSLYIKFQYIIIKIRRKVKNIYKN